MNFILLKILPFCLYLQQTILTISFDDFFKISNCIHKWRLSGDKVANYLLQEPVPFKFCYATYSKENIGAVAEALQVQLLAEHHAAHCKYFI